MNVGGKFPRSRGALEAPQDQCTQSPRAEELNVPSEQWEALLGMRKTTGSMLLHV